MLLTIKITNWEIARTLSQELIRWAFRGQSDATWQLESSFERLANTYKCILEGAKGLRQNRESWMLRQFRRRAHHYISAPPEMENSLEWLALIQHHGGPTRLLDFTHSFYVAAFFACESAMSDSAVWGINLEKLEAAIAPTTGGQASNETIADLNSKHIRAANHILNSSTSQKILISVEPERLHERLSTQQGLFIFPGDINVPFNDCFESTFAPLKEIPTKTLTLTEVGQIKSVDVGAYPLIKIVLPRKGHFKVLDDLVKMNINSSTLFPGLDGFARSLRFHLRVMEMDGK